MGKEKSEISKEKEREGPTEEVVFQLILKVAWVKMEHE
jgi:hypothetical protein